ncbi:beta-galactosidase family protein [Mucilaginibacter sp.]|jgi:beta-galactosidase|uniref:glycoside hydrolase family 35 protein n=1 Tax=Mucilaginibacter sp. TaxID=1882438 RepID=UPI002C01173D|nr:beta-galactosidase family protein [Mucilaginibacter sp.]HTI58925.1 beta-galactosidase family protein [Mucilaginibacter sp.]
MRNIKYFLLLIISFVVSSSFAQKSQHTFSLGDSVFLLDGKPFQMISGEMHYPRIPREAWRARMKMAKAMGLNTIGTYVFWNVHEPEKGKFDFSGNNDVAEFVRIAKEEGLWVILRPSPYICAEWEFGGYPYWLQNEKGLEVRSKEQQYLKAYDTYIREVGKQLAPLQVNHGGNILMVQVENEYGSYGSDREYLAINQKMFRDAGFDGLLYTCDPPADLMKGYLPGLLPAVNGDDPGKVKSLVKAAHDGKGPFYIAEWYPAWFDWWGTAHHTVPAAKYTGQLDTILAAGISINMYMFHGGTTRGFMNGANFKDGTPFEPEISSYDYDAPLDEAGNATAKFMAFRKVIEKHLPVGQALPEVPPAKPAIAIPSIKLTGSATLEDNLPKAKLSKEPLTFEDMKQAYGYVLYRAAIEGGKTGFLKINGLRDYAVVVVNGKTAGVLDRRLKQDSLLIKLPKGKVKLDILAENLGRINFGKYLLQNKKGITGKVTFNGKEVDNWKMYQYPFSNIHSVRYLANISSTQSQPSLYHGVFQLKKTGDTYLDMSKWGKGVVWINGHNLGRYWNIGPQQTLYIPVEWLKKGNNEVVVFELLQRGSDLSSLARPILDKLK